MNSLYACLLFFAGLPIDVLTAGIPTIAPSTPVDQPQRIIAFVHESAFQVYEVGSTVRYHCFGRSEDNDIISTEWQKENGQLPPGRSYDNRNGILIIRDVQVTDSGVYVCRVSDGVNIATRKLTLTVKAATIPSFAPPLLNPSIVPSDWAGESGDTVRLACILPLIWARISWSRLGNAPLPDSAIIRDGVLTISNASSSDSGFYICTAAIYRDVETSAIASVSIRSLAKPSVVRVDVDRQVVSEGTLIEMNCVATGNPTPRITWTKRGQPIGAHIQTVGNILRIVDSKVSDQGTYECHATNSEGSSVGQAEVRVQYEQLNQLNQLNQPNQLNLQISPTTEILQEGSDVHFECWDQGPLGTTVRWFREGFTDLPAGSTDKNGRLTIPNVQIIHSGNYVCKAVEFPEDTPEQKIIARLYVKKPQQLDLKTYPQEQVIKANREVIITCRDEGPFRAKVHWIRDDGASLPTGSTDNNGRLEMPNIQVTQSGNYMCEALGFSEDTPGRRVTSHLTVEEDEVILRPFQPCKFNETTCSNGDCIPISKVCDGRYDCTDGAEELRCSAQGRCEPNQFQCVDKECVSKVWRCDGDRDCIDGSDEENCEPPPPGSPCKPTEYQCARNDQCILKSFQCDKDKDCADGSDEIGCTKVRILNPPERLVILNVGETFVITCTALGIPLPEISWRFNFGHIPEKCRTTSINGIGTLTCPSITIEDQGAYSCEAINIFGWEIATPDSILRVKSPSEEICPRGTFNSLARTAEECISCFCSGVATECASAELFTYQLPVPFDQHNVSLVEIYQDIEIQDQVSGKGSDVHPVGRNGAKNTDLSSDSGNPQSVLYFALPESYHGSQLRSYGGYLKYTVQYTGWGIPNEAPAVILTGNNYVLVHKSEYISPDYENEMSVRFFVGDWLRVQGWKETIALREDIMMALADVDNILIKVQYDDILINTIITDVFMDTADVDTTGQGATNFVEECRCPVGYTGLSCEHCEPGYIKRNDGPGLGQCYKDESVRIEDSSIKVDDCDPRGSISQYVDPVIGACQCKTLATGSTCDKCKAHTFHLAETNELGCISCFCMGITTECDSSNWYRSVIHADFTSSVHNFSLVEPKYRDSSPIVDGIRVNTIDGEIVYNAFPNQETNEVYYWQLPSSFLGNRLTSYGGNLKYTVRYAPSQGDGRPRNNAFDVELISSNDITLYYYSGKLLEPNTSKTFTIPLVEEYWQRHDGIRAGREHLLMALADVDAIRIKAAYTTHTDEAAISSISLDTAVNLNTGMARAVEVEQCSCPIGYRGLSCEDCDIGYTRSDDGLYLGRCEPCSCNEHSTQCDPETGICENCRDHTTGDNCESCDYGYEGDATRGSPQDCKPGDDVTNTP